MTKVGEYLGCCIQPKVPIKTDHNHGILSSSMMMLKMFTAFVLICSVGAKYFIVETEGNFN